MNLLAVGIVRLNIAVALALYYALQGRVEMPMMVGILCGALTNTPGLGAAKEALKQLSYYGPEIAMGYACAYPLGVMGIILSMIVIRYLCRVDMNREAEEIQQEEEANPHLKPYTISDSEAIMTFIGPSIDMDWNATNHSDKPMVSRRILVTQPQINGKTLGELHFSSMYAFIGPSIDMDWNATNHSDKPMVSRRILVTQPQINGKTLGELHFSSMYGVNVTRVNRSGMDLFAARNLRLQVGDRVMVVGTQDAIERVAGLLGNQLKRLDHPNIVTIFVGILCGIFFGSLPIAIPGMPTPVKLGLAGVLGNQLKRLDHPNIVTIFVGILCGIFFGSLPIAIPGMPTPVKLGLAGGPLIISILIGHPNIVTIFVGILCGIFFGSLPIAIPGMPTPVKLGLAGGPLIISILIGRFGHKVKLVTYTTMSANLMLREVGLVLFLASVGIKAGGNFVQMVVEGDGLLYVGLGFLITIIPLLIMGMIARWHHRVNYYTLMGLIAGSNTDPPALAYANQISGNDAPAVGYSTVYPLAMFLRILTAQLLILTLAG